MKLNQVIKVKLSILLILALCFLGCAGVGPALKTGMTALQVVDSFYDYVVASQAIPNTLQAATIILQQADVVAATAKTGVNTPELIAQAKMLSDQANKL